ncbi:MAG TPA: aminotransferase class V-fold PLP-dependent enzyme [Chloroflexia bacterium]|nr:aminotransferase class V-fold PLP-dependent enzyme [Chloroflexia bacterium]
MSTASPAGAGRALATDPGRWPAHDDLLRYRADFPIFAKTNYLNSCSLGALSVRTMAGINEYMALWGSMGAAAWYEIWLGRLAELRQQIGALIHASAEEIAIGPSISSALTVISSCIDYGQRNKIVTTDLDFPTVGHQWLAKHKQGVEVVFVPHRDRISVDLDAFEQAIDERTALVVTSHVFFTSGYVQDIKAIAEIAHRKGALVVIDAYQGTGQIPTDVQDAGVDFLLSGGLKWLLGGTGIVFTYARRDLLPQLEPSVPGWFAMKNQFAFDIHSVEYPDTALRLEQGTHSISAVYALLGGLSYIAEIGPAALRERTQHLTEDLITRALAAGFAPRVAPDPAHRSGIVLLNMENPRPVVTALAQAGTIVDMRPGAVRVSPYFYNTIEENQIVVDAMVKIRDQGGQ